MFFGESSVYHKPYQFYLSVVNIHVLYAESSCITQDTHKYFFSPNNLP